jgi:hypothetical protein
MTSDLNLELCESDRRREVMIKEEVHWRSGQQDRQMMIAPNILHREIVSSGSPTSNVIHLFEYSVCRNCNVEEVVRENSTSTTPPNGQRF